MYKSLNEHYREKFGCKVYKLSLDGGFTCPNRDGSLGTRGCIFCSELGGGEFAERGENIAQKLENARKRVESKNKGGKYIAYFQAFSGTYAEPNYLERLYFEAIAPDYIVGLAVGTRPDCLSDEIIELLSRVNEIKPVSIELGLQSSNEATALYIRRGYENSVYADAVKRLKARNIEVVTHIIIGLPNESSEDAVNTTRYAAECGSDGVKFHLLHVLKGTDLQAEFEAGRFKALSLEDYAAILKRCINALPEGVVVHRITGDGDKKSLIAPMWSADKKRVLNYLSQYLA